MCAPTPLVADRIVPASQSSNRVSVAQTSFCKKASFRKASIVTFDQQPFTTAPPVGSVTTVAPGLYWLRLALPFRLDHVNVYLLDDNGGLAVVDTGLFDDPTCAIWEQLLPTLGRPITRIIATHCHPDHVGLAGWLARRTGAPLLMSQADYLLSLIIHQDPAALESDAYRDFYRGHGLDEAATARMLRNGHAYLRMVSPLPRVFQRLIAGEVLSIGTRRWNVLTGGGHAPEQVMLHCPADGLLLSADQVLARITPNISVQAMDPMGDPLGIYLRSLRAIRSAVPDDTLVLPGHNLPFRGLHARLDELDAHHASRCAAILAACQNRPHSAAALVPVVFGRIIDDPHQMGFAFSEALAHANRLLRTGALIVESNQFRAG